MEGSGETGTEPFVLCIGAAALDLVMDVETMPAEDGRVRARSATLAGGGPAGTAAVAMCRLGTRVSFAGSVGEDDAGTLIRAGLVRERVDVSHLRTVAGGSSRLASGIVRSAGGTRTLVAYPGTLGETVVSAALESASRAADWIHADHEGYGVVRELRRRGVETPVSLDGGNPIADLDLDLIDIYAPAASELLRWTGASSVEDGLARALAAGARVTIATHGATGSTALSTVEPDLPDLTTALRGARRAGSTGTSWTIRQTAYPIARTEGSTLGAGDVFHGALLAAILKGRSLRAAMAFASAASSISCRALDGRSAIPTAAEVDGLLGEHDTAEATGRVGWS
ncbi:MAG: sulfofructose kinase [Chloroflexota bacterium]|nr:sulfofructose kinase [Chloroflexota bacterium]